MIFDGALAAPGDENDVLDARRDAFLDRILDQRLVHNGQHFLGDRLRRRQKSRSQPSYGQDGLAHFLGLSVVMCFLGMAGQHEASLPAYANIAIFESPARLRRCCDRKRTRESLILGIESSCDETAAAVVAGGRRILSSVVASQTEIHRKYGGVVPELASREHLRQIVPVVREAVEQAHVSLQDVDAVAVTHGPGLVGALLVGVTYGKVLAHGARKTADWRESSGRPRPRRVSRGACGGTRTEASRGLPDRFRRPHDSLST